MISSPGASVRLDLGVLARAACESRRTGSSRSPLGPRTCTIASSAASATHMSDGCVAMHWSLRAEDGVHAVAAVDAPRSREPGSRLLQPGSAMSRKYGQRVRCSRLPPIVAMLRSCGDAPASSACDEHRESALDERVVREVAVAHQRADAHAAVRPSSIFVERQRVDVDERRAASRRRASSGRRASFRRR